MALQAHSDSLTIVSAMTTPRKTAQPEIKHPGTKPEWLDLPRRSCDNCGARYKPMRPNSRFCDSNCQKSFHKHGGAYAKLKETISKEISRQMAVLAPCQKCRGTGRRRRHRHEPCNAPGCQRGRVLTDYGRSVLAAIREILPATTQPSPSGD
jgi:hypothetical protein